jgi:SAM-dependent methyltransferase/uncharacterized protein YbaR (Trm112 family)
LYCINHDEKRTPLVLESLITDPEAKNECREGFLTCPKCSKKYPIISGIAIIIRDMLKYVAQRPTIFGKWYAECESQAMKDFLKDLSMNMSKSFEAIDDRYESYGRYFQTYKWLHNENFESDKFLHLLRWKIKPSDIYRKLTSGINFNPEGIALDLGCALGLSTYELSKKFSFAIGVDASFSFILEAKRRSLESGITNTEFFVADILNLPFNTQKFDLVFGLNILEFLPLEELLSAVHALLKPNCLFVTTSPYDYNREIVYNPELNDQVLRLTLEKMGFEVTIKTKKESYIPWILKINERTYLFYFLDLVEASKVSKHKH